MKVIIPSALYSYTEHKKEIAAEGNSIDQVLRDMDRQFPGIRFRIINEQDEVRPHMRIFINEVQEFDIRKKVSSNDEMMLVMALSGG